MSPSPVRYLSVKQFTERAAISESTTRRRIDAGDLPAIQPGGPGTKILIPENALDLLLPTPPEASGQAGVESVANPVADPVDASSSASSAAPSPFPAHRRGPIPRWLITSPR